MNNAQPYRFGQSASQTPALMGGLERIGEKMARKLRSILENYASTRPIVKAKPVDQTMFMMWDACVPPFVSLSLYRFHPVKGPVTLRLDAGLISLLVDRFYGGTGPRREVEKREFTPTEARLIVRITGEIIEALMECWGELTTVESALIGRETGIAHAEIMKADDDCVVQSFEIDLGEKDKRTIDLVYPFAGLAGIELSAAARVIEEDRRPADPAWRHQLAKQMDNIRLPARSVLARPSLKVNELVALKPGDVIPIHIARQLPLIIGDRVFAHGSIGEQDGRAAFMIEKLA
jgi:flagellar motor switch protein FliM